ncbi:gluconolactonase [Okibacterium sp. HSC-33S16]|uniref:SMP-30/gluconolactonase/LRE family protein n=1 Tax=Okibacterium sp. HSC-33S16 TaxID=2910965 RepID=UPI00209D11E7|nr:SMP-30/gluconolactonase/LRE family protein [Okibacterium sp. HSC-33S16]MCP2031183.1 gluconolactonase [Okibacterium sp. HSC-33S16]
MPDLIDDANSDSGALLTGGLEKLWTGGEWLEGPLWLPHSQSVRFSDIPNNRILEFDRESGETQVHRTDVEYTNGRILDLDGRVVQCSHGRRAMEREVDGVVEVLVDRWTGGRFNSPNDVVVASDSTIWFTDPPYGIQPSGREGHPGEQEYGGCFVFRLDEASGVATPVITDMVHPNGLAFSPDESLLYVADTGGDEVRHIRVYDVATGEGREFVRTAGTPDGFRVDTAGRVWTSSSKAVEVFAPTGELLLTLPVPEVVSNVCFGGPNGTELYLTASTSLYRISTTVTDATWRRAPRGERAV